MAEARNPYLAKHSIPELLDTIVSKLLLLQPHHPVRFIINECSEVEQDVKRLKAGVQSNEGDFPDLKGKHSIMANVLTKEIYRLLYKLRTAHGGSLDDVIQVGIDIPENLFSYSCGCVCTDAQCYFLFSPLLKYVIKSKHKDWDQSIQHEERINSLLDSPSSYVLNSPLVLGSYATLERSVRGSAFPYLIRRGDRRIISESVQGAVRNASVEGDWLPIPNDRHVNKIIPSKVADITPANAMSLVSKTILTLPVLSSQYDQHINISRDWPDGRAQWLSSDKDISIWTNVYEHIALRMVDSGRDISKGLDKLLSLGIELEQLLREIDCEIAYSKELGSLVSHPGNLGTSFEVGVVVQLRHLTHHVRFDELLKALSLTTLTIPELQSTSYFESTTSSTCVGNHPTLTRATANVDDETGIICVLSTRKMSTTINLVVRETVNALQHLLVLEELLIRKQCIDAPIGKLIR